MMPLVGRAQSAADSSPQPLPALSGRPDVSDSQDLLGAIYQNPTAGIAFRTPGACEQLKGTVGEQIARFADPGRKWELVASQSTTAIPMKLSGASVSNSSAQTGTTQP